MSEENFKNKYSPCSVIRCENKLYPIKDVIGAVVPSWKLCDNDIWKKRGFCEW